MPRESKSSAADAVYDVLVFGFDPKVQAPAEGLKRVFGVDDATAQALVAALPSVVSRGVNHVRAEYFSRALRSIGALIEVRDQNGAPVTFGGEPQVPQLSARKPAPANDVVAAIGMPQPSAADPQAAWGELMREVPKPNVHAPAPAPAPATPQLEAGGPAEYGALSMPPFAEETELALQSVPPARGVAAPAPKPAPLPTKPAAPAAPKPRPQLTAAAPAPVRKPSPPQPSEFWQDLGECLLVPWRDRGKLWLVSIILWSLFVNVLSVLSQAVPFVGVSFIFMANTSVLAFCADYHRRCMWAVANGESSIEEAPDFEARRMLQVYMREGLHLIAFLTLLELPLVIWLANAMLEDGVLSATELTRSGWFWLTASVPSLYWPMAVATASLYNRFPGVWYVPIGVRALLRAPVEYLTIFCAGLVTFMVPWACCRLVGTAVGFPGVFAVTLVGLPLAASHAVMGALTGQLMRAQPKLFE